ncbi:hypothetical protein L798_04895, partial [Zootermopsis nevadensis]
QLCLLFADAGMKCGGLFRLSAGNPKLVERLRASFDRTGDADLEGAGDVATVASLLKLWLRELPEPVIASHVATDLLCVHEKLHDETGQWRESVCQLLMTLPDPNICLLRYLLRFLRHVDQHSHRTQCRHFTPGGVGAVFSPLLIQSQQQQLVASQLTAKLIHECNHIFQDRLLLRDLLIFFLKPSDKSSFCGEGQAEVVAAPASSHKNQHQHRKRKERHESFNSQSQERKVISVNCKDSIRRVSSHEDFSLVKGVEVLGRCYHIGIYVCSQRFSGLPLHERNSASVSAPKTPAPNVDNESTAATVAEMFDDNEHEQRRNSERFSRAVTPRGRRNMARRRKIVHKTAKTAPEDMDGGGSSKERGRSPSPSPSPCTPPLDLATLHQQVDCNEPLTSFSNWSFAHRQPEEEPASSQVMLSPRNSMILTRRVYLDPSVPPSPPNEHNVSVPRKSGVSGQLDSESRLKTLSKQINSLKKKLKHYEEQFEREYGYRPSHADKMGNKGIEKMYADLNKLRKEVKYLKEDPHCVIVESSTKPLELVIEGSAAVNGGVNSNSDKTPSMEEKLQEVEKHLSEKRLLAGRFERLEELTREQLLDEKVAVQKALLYLEGIFGRPVTRGDRDLVRPLYDRYRALKRLVIRSGPSKLKDSLSELATILEHETMDFTSSPPSLSVQEETPEALAVADNADVPTEFHQTSESSDSLWENLHSLPLSELLNQQRTTREEKKRLRRSLREYEEDFQRRTGKKLQREDRVPMENMYVAYKQAKAKLRLLEALVTKQT